MLERRTVLRFRSLWQRRHHAVDPCSGVQLRRADQHEIPQRDVNQAQIESANNSLGLQRVQDIAGWNWRFDHEFVEELPFGRHAIARYLGNFFREVVGVLVSTLCDFAEPFGSQRRHIDCRRRSHQPLIGADVGSGLFTPDVLFARLQREHEPAVAI